MSVPAAEQPQPEQFDADPLGPAQQPWVPSHPAKRHRLLEGLVGLGVAVLVALVGVPLGLLWTRFAPHPRKIVLYDYALYTGDERLVAGEGWYLFAAVATGAVLAVLAWVVLRRFRGPVILLGLALGGIAAGVLMYGTGHRAGAAQARYLLAHSPPGTVVRMPVDLAAQRVGLWHGWLPFARGDVLCLAIAAVLVYLVLAGFSAYPTLRPPRSEVSSDY